MQIYTTVILKPGEGDRVVAGHPWIYEGSVQRVTGPVMDGDVVQVKDPRQRFLGVGFFNGKSKIRVRLLAKDRAVINAAFFEERIRSAWEHRGRYYSGASTCRVVNAEGDFLSGLVVDKYEDVLVIQVTSLGMEQRKAEIVRGLESVLKPRAILERSDTAKRALEGMEPSVGVLWGSDPGEVEVSLNGLRWGFRPLTGHKTGLYLDQQENYRLVADLARRCGVERAVDAFCFQGGFGLHLAKNGVGQVLGLDQGEEIIEEARGQARRNGMDTRCRFEAVNVFDWLKAQVAAGTSEGPMMKYDMVVLDPPSFTRHRSTVGDALRGYKEIHLRALKLLRVGGVLATFCCSHHVDGGLFLDCILSAAFDARRVLRRLGVYTQAVDHPVVPSIPETEYLKGYAFEVLG